MVSAGSSVTGAIIGWPPSRSFLRGCVLICISLVFAVYLLFWFYEGLSPRMDAVAAFSARTGVLAYSSSPRVMHKPHGCMANIMVCVPETMTVRIP